MDRPPLRLSLRAKVQWAVAGLTLAFIGAAAHLQYREFRESVHEEVMAANRVAGQLLQRMVRADAMRSTTAMLGFLQGVGRIRSNDVALFDAAGAELYHSPPSPYKAGRDAPAWFAQRVAPQPIEQTIELPDGKLVVRTNASRAALDAWDHAVDLATIAVLLLVALNTVLFWVVGRTVAPFGQIVAALKQVEAGRFDTALPPLRGVEAHAIGAAFNRMVAVLRSQLDAEKRALHAELQLSGSRELAHWVDRRIEEERRMIARELHDELGQSVTAIRSMALSVAQRVRAHDAQAEAAARTIADEASRLYDAMHGLIPRLAPLVLDALGLADALQDLAARTRRAHAGVQVDIDVGLDGVRLSTDAALALYRAAQEGITNALRHGAATHLQLRLHARGQQVELELIDDGRGLDTAEGQLVPEAAGAADAGRTGGHGLGWLRERMESLGGSVALHSVVPRGLRLCAQVPLGQADAHDAQPDDAAIGTGSPP